MTEALPLAAAALLVVAGAVFMLVGVRSRRLSPVDQLLEEFETFGAPVPLDEYQERLRLSFGRRLLLPFGRGLVDRVRSLLPRHHLEAVSRRIVLAGLGGRWSAEEHIASQAVGTVVGGLVGLGAGAVLDWSGARVVLLAAAVALLGAAVPALAVRQAREKRVQAMQRDLPEVLDLLAISVEAGVGLEGAIASATERFPGPLGAELAHALSEMELGASRREALEHLRERTEVPDLDAFVLSLLQATALGMPLTRVLKTEAAELRRRRRQQVREAAAKLPVKLVFPLIVFIMPAMFVVIIGPAIVRIGESILGG